MKNFDEVEKELYGAIINEQAAYEMAQVGKAGGVEIWVWPREGGYTPHFHFWNTDKTISGCIKLESSEYFEHGQYKSKLDTHQRRQLVAFLKANSKNFPGLTNWQTIIGIWNSSNPQKTIDLNTPMPNYLELK